MDSMVALETKTPSRNGWGFLLESAQRLCVYIFCAENHLWVSRWIVKCLFFGFVAYFSFIRQRRACSAVAFIALFRMSLTVV
jgi:hypothetical protein